MSELRVVILGGTGCGGRAAAVALRAQGHTVVTVARGRGELPPDVACDRNDLKGLRAAIKGADVVVDHVAYAPEEVQGVADCWPTSASRYIFVSSAVVHGGARAHPYSEDEPLAPADLFSCRKAEAERLARTLPGAVIVRVGGLYGPGQPPLTPTGRDSTLFDRLHRREPMLVPIDGGRLQPWFSADHGCLLAALVDDPAPPPVLNAAGEECITWAEVLATWARAVGAPLPTCVPAEDEGLRAAAAPFVRPFLPAILRPPHLNNKKMIALYGKPQTLFAQGTRLSARARP